MDGSVAMGGAMFRRDASTNNSGLQMTSTLSATASASFMVATSAVAVGKSWGA